MADFSLFLVAPPALRIESAVGAVLRARICVGRPLAAPAALKP